MRRRPRPDSASGAGGWRRGRSSPRVSVTSMRSVLSRVWRTRRKSRSGHREGSDHRVQLVFLDLHAGAERGLEGGLVGGGDGAPAHRVQEGVQPSGLVEAVVRGRQLVLVVDIRRLLQLPHDPQFLVPAVALQGGQLDQVSGGGFCGTRRVVARGGRADDIGDHPGTAAHGDALTGGRYPAVRCARRVRIPRLHGHLARPPSFHGHLFSPAVVEVRCGTSSDTRAERMCPERKPRDSYPASGCGAGDDSRAPGRRSCGRAPAESIVRCVRNRRIRRLAGEFG